VIECQKPIFCDPYRRNRVTGSFILIDPLSNATVAAGMITGREPVVSSSASEGTEQSSAAKHRITRMEQQSRAGHRVATVWLETAPEVAFHVERMLFDANCRVHAISAADTGINVVEVARVLNDAGVIALVYGLADAETRERVRQQAGADHFLTIEPPPAGESVDQTAHRVFAILKEAGLVLRLSQPE
jgi:bifunctional enzyme CysN/CysC/sulfate adenylyltransferase subunit 1